MARDVKATRMSDNKVTGVIHVSTVVMRRKESKVKLSQEEERERERRYFYHTHHSDFQV